ncbi:MAG: hypothetical protein ACQGVC_22740 [Myxococcota bacterium]
MGTGSPDPAPGLDALLASAGWNLRAALPVGRYDRIVPPAFGSAALLPGARSVLVLGSGGRALWQAFRAAPEFGRGSDPLDAMTERVAARAAALLGGREILAHRPLGGSFADFVALGREAGLGAPGRLGLLLHPEYGPWLSLRAAVLTALDLPVGTPLAGFDPCTGCPAPCQAACHGDALPPEGFRVDRCAAARSREPCRDRCDARRACVLGPNHRYAPEAEAHHMTRAGVPPGPG